jgi:hypothetical protein
MLQPNSPIAPNGRRTNSLAFCRTDCHTCAAAGQRCDRRRPQCSTCLDQGRQCGGFATPLTWASKRMRTDSQPAGEAEDATPTVRSKSGSRDASSSAPRRFRFVMGASRPRKCRKTAGEKGSARRPASTLDDRADNDVPATSGKDLQLLDTTTDQTARPADDLIPAPDTAFLGDEADLFDSIVPSALGPMPFLDLGQDASAGAGDNMLASLFATPPFNAMEPTVESPSDTRDRLDPMTQNLGSAVDPVQMSYTPNNALRPGLSEVFRNEHDDLLQMCMQPPHLTRDVRHTDRKQTTPSFASSR